jgi:hypothetical protein
MGQAQIAQRLEEEVRFFSNRNSVWFLLWHLSMVIRLQERVRRQGKKSFARTIDDDELNTKWKGVDRWGDPLALKAQVMCVALS